MDVFRAATPLDAEALTDLERDANLVALAHVFPDTPYPADEVRARWERVLLDPEVRVDVCGPPTRLDAYVVLGRSPCSDTWRYVPRDGGAGWPAGRSSAPPASSRLWCLVENAPRPRPLRALGWQPTGREQSAEWPPYPREMEYAR